MANSRSSSSFFSSFLSPRGDTLLYLIALLSIFSLLVHHVSAAGDSHFEGFDADEELEDDSIIFQQPLSDLPRRSPPPPTTLSTSADPESHHGPPSDSHLPPKPSATTSSFDYWDEDEFEGFPTETSPPELTNESEPTTTPADSASAEPDEKSTISEPISLTKRIRSYTIEIACVCFLIMFTINYFTPNGHPQRSKIDLPKRQYVADSRIFAEAEGLPKTCGVVADSALMLPKWLPKSTPSPLTSSYINFT